jgi:hypothetical protein
VNIQQALEKIFSRHRRRGYSLFVDLSKAFDRIDREKLFEILKRRSSSAEEHHITALIIQLHSNCPVEIGSRDYFFKFGVVQGSVFSPLLFSVYLEEALRTLPSAASHKMRGLKGLCRRPNFTSLHKIRGGNHY